MASRQLDEDTIFPTARKIENLEARNGYLDQICAGDQALRERVEALLAEDKLLESCRNRWATTHTHFVLAIDLLAKGDRIRAEEQFNQALKTNTFRAYVHWCSEAFLARMKDDPT